MPELTAELTKELEKLRKALQSGKNDIVPFVGVGLSCPPLPGWREILEEILVLAPEGAQAVARASLAEGKLREAALALEDPQNRAGIESALVANSAKPHETRPPVFKALAALPLQHYVTTCRDPWLKAAVSEKLKASPMVLVPSDANAFTELTPQSPPVIVMLHGDAERPETVVLAEAGYKTLGRAPRSYAAALKGLVGNRKILFVGCSPQDPDVGALLDEWAELFGADEASGVSAPRHYFLGTGLSEPDKALLFKLRIRPIEIGAAGDEAALGQALAVLSGTAPPPGAVGLETSRQAARPATAPVEKSAPAPAPTGRFDASREPAASAPAKEKYDPLAKLKAAEAETALKADVKRLEEALAAATARAQQADALEAEAAQLRAHDAEAKKLEQEIVNAYEKRDAEAKALEAQVVTLTAKLGVKASDDQGAGELAKRAQNLENTVAQLEKMRGAHEDTRLNLESEKRELEQKLAEAAENLKAREAQFKKLETEKAAPSPDVAKYTRSLEEKTVALDKARVALEADVKKHKAAAEAARADVDRVRGELEPELADARAKLQAEQQKPPVRASKIPLVLGVLFLLAGLGAAGVAIFEPSLLDPLRSALNPGAAGGSQPGGGGR